MTDVEGGQPTPITLEMLVSEALRKFRAKEKGENEAGEHGYVPYMAAKDTMNEVLGVDGGTTLDDLFDLVTTQTQVTPYDIGDIIGEADSWQDLKRKSVYWIIEMEMGISDRSIREETERRIEDFGEERAVPNTVDLRE